MPYFLQYPEIILRLAVEHIFLAVTALGIAIIIAIPLGWLLHRNKTLEKIVMAVLGVVYTIPSIALMIILIPFLGLNKTNVIVALVLYSQIILLRNILSGLNGIPNEIIEAAKGMGLTPLQMAWKIQLPLALPVILAGIRIAAVVVVAIATIGAKFGAGGLGTLLFDGIAQAGRMDKIWTGAISVGLIAFALSRFASYLQGRFSYPQ